MRAKCTRCQRRTQIEFEFERIEKGVGIKGLSLCAHCLRWVLIETFSQRANFFDFVYQACKSAGDIVRGSADSPDKQVNINTPAKLPEQHENQRTV